jgi:hypothetical protein
MCDVTTRSRRARTIPRPRWGLLYGIATLMLAALAAVEFVASLGAAQTVLRCGLVLGGLGAIALWARLNRMALDQQNWCDCAAERITVRVILSRRAVPERAEEETLEEIAS